LCEQVHGAQACGLPAFVDAQVHADLPGVFHLPTFARDLAGHEHEVAGDHEGNVVSSRRTGWRERDAQFAEALLDARSHSGNPSDSSDAVV
jgi:hypothetical protein